MSVDLRQEVQVETRLRLLAQVGTPGGLEQRATHQAGFVEFSTGAAVDRSERHRVDTPRRCEYRGSRSVRRRDNRSGRWHRRDRVAARGIGEVVRWRASGDERGAVTQPVRLDERGEHGSAIRILHRNADSDHVLDEIGLRRQVDRDRHADGHRRVEIDHPAHVFVENDASCRLRPEAWQP